MRDQIGITDRLLTPFTRRQLLRFTGLTALAGIAPRAALAVETGLLRNSTVAAASAKEAVDHLLFACADLDVGIAWVREHAGVSAAMGGVHPGVGTRNALVSLGSSQYLEIIGLDPAQQTKGPTAQQIQSLRSPQMLTWAAGTKDIAAVAARARAAGLAVDGPVPGSRKRPDGRTLSWKAMRIQNDLGAVVPFFIEWGAGSVHPSADSPAGCKLATLELEHPQPERVRDLLLKLGMASDVRHGAAPKLKVKLDTPKGELELP